MRGKLLWFILRDGVNWSPCSLETVCEQEYAQVYMMISGGDSKTFKLLSDQLPYGASNLASKHECVGHVQKRMCTALREKAKEKFVNERGERVRMRWKGRITDKTIKLLTRYYGKAIRSSTGVCAAMQDAVWAEFYHSQSTDSSPQHQYCPSGQRSTAPVLPQWPAVHSTSIAPVASGPQHQCCPSGQRSTAPV